MAILPELIIMTAATAFFGLSLLKKIDFVQAKNAAIFFGILAIIGTLISDILLAWLDPRIRME